MAASTSHNVPPLSPDGVWVRLPPQNSPAKGLVMSQVVIGLTWHAPPPALVPTPEMSMR